MQAADLVIIGNIVTPDGVIENGYVCVADGKIVAVGEMFTGNVRQVYDAKGQWVFPGVVDGQVHTGSQADREGLGLGTRGAAAGGVTSIVDMPYDSPTPVTTADIFKQKIAEVEREAYVDVALYGTIAKVNGMSEIQPMIEAGACGFKVSQYETDPKRFARIPPYDMLEVFRIVAPSGLACGVHNENQEVINHEIDKVNAAGDNHYTGYGLSRPPISETLAINEVYEIGVESGCRAHVVHCSLDRGFEICESFKALGYQSSIETCIQYLVFSEEDMEELGTKIKQGPPIRRLPEREKLWQRIADGQVDFVSSDHVAWSWDRKSKEHFLSNASGMPGLETLLPAFYTGCVERGLPMTRVAQLLAENVAKHFCIYPQKGVIQVGSDADFAIVAPEPTVFDENKQQGASEWSPFHGREMAGRVRATFVRGQQVWDGENVLVDSGFGNFVRPKHTIKDHINGPKIRTEEV